MGAWQNGVTPNNRNLDERQTMSDLDAAVAEKVMGHRPFVQIERVQEYGIDRGKVHPARIILFASDPYDKRIGWKPEQLRPYTDADAGLRSTAIGGGFPPYSEDMGSAWNVVERMQSLGWWFYLVGATDGRYRAKFIHDPKGGEYRDFSADADTMAIAICKAALLALAD
jgi:hypothetical protein